MPLLKNIKHERFAQELASGKTASEAYIAAGYAANEGNASRLRRNAKVEARVAEILGKAADRVELTEEWVISRLMRITERSLQEVPVVKDGEEIGEFVYDSNAANRALELLGKKLGLYNTKIELSGYVGLGDRLDAALSAAGRRLPVTSTPKDDQ